MEKKPNDVSIEETTDKEILDLIKEHNDPDYYQKIPEKYLIINGDFKCSRCMTKVLSFAGFWIVTFDDLKHGYEELEKHVCPKEHEKVPDTFERHGEPKHTVKDVSATII